MWSQLDSLITRLFFRHRFFEQGWGDITLLAAARGLPGPVLRWDDEGTVPAFRERALRPGPPAAIDIAWEAERHYPGGARVCRGLFAAPVNRAMLPAASHTAYVERVSPAVPAPGNPACILFAATGEQGFLTRRLLALALAREGVTSLVPETPFYGLRRPPGQHGAFLNHFLDLLAMFDSSVEEGRSLLQWLHDAGHAKLAVSGISMGGSVSALVAARAEFPVAAVCLIPSHSVAPVFTEGVIARHVAWDALHGELPAGRDAPALMRRYLSVFDVTALPRPLAETASCFLSATHDGCIPRHSTDSLHQHWPDARVEWITGGHSSAAILGWNRYRRAILQAVR